MVRKILTTVFVFLLALTLSSCTSFRGNPATVLPSDAVEKIGKACDRVDDFRDKYVELRPTVIENREWLEELMPGMWDALVQFDQQAPEVYEVINLVCRLFAGDLSAQAELDAQRVALERRGVDWNELIALASKIATLLL